VNLRVLSTGAAVVALAGATAALGSPAVGGSGVVSASGAVGPLRIDRSSEAAVRAFAGRPAFSRAARSDPSMPRYRALGYECVRSPASGRRDPLLVGPRGGPRSNVYCRTIYYVALSSGKLAAFYTGSAGFRTPRGTRIGTSQADAARRERSAPQAGCTLQILLRTRAAALSIRLAGERVLDFELESTAKPVGLQFC
jgi:hypothetical protein